MTPLTMTLKIKCESTHCNKPFLSKVRDLAHPRPVALLGLVSLLVVPWTGKRGHGGRSKTWLIISQADSPSVLTVLTAQPSFDQPSFSSFSRIWPFASDTPAPHIVVATTTFFITSWPHRFANKRWFLVYVPDVRMSDILWRRTIPANSPLFMSVLIKSFWN